MDTLGSKDDEGATIIPKVANAFPNKPNGGPKLDITIMAAQDARMVVEGAEMVEGSSMTSTH